MLVIENCHAHRIPATEREDLLSSKTFRYAFLLWNQASVTLLPAPTKARPITASSYMLPVAPHTKHNWNSCRTVSPYCLRKGFDAAQFHVYCLSTETYITNIIICDKRRRMLVTEHFWWPLTKNIEKNNLYVPQKKDIVSSYF